MHVLCDAPVEAAKHLDGTLINDFIQWSRSDLLEGRTPRSYRGILVVTPTMRSWNSVVVFLCDWNAFREAP